MAGAKGKPMHENAIALIKHHVERVLEPNLSAADASGDKERAATLAAEIRSYRQSMFVLTIDRTKRGDS